jgi:hypothetical protein
LDDRAVKLKSTVVAGALKKLSLRSVRDKAAGVRTDGVERDRLFGPFRAAQINCTDGLVGKAVPGIRSIGNHRKLARHAVIGHGVERRHAEKTISLARRSPPQRVDKREQTHGKREHSDYGARDGGRRFNQKVAPFYSLWRWL